MALLGDTPGVNAILKVESGANRADNTRMAIQSEAVSHPINSLDTGAVRPENLCNLEFFKPIRGPVDLFIFGVEEMQSTNCRIHRRRPDDLPRILQGVNDAGVSATGQKDQTARGVEY